MDDIQNLKFYKKIKRTLHNYQYWYITIISWWYLADKLADESQYLADKFSQ